jgi:hypothetical protein
MGTWVDDDESIAQAILQLRYNDLMKIATDINVLVLSDKIDLDEPHQRAALLYEWDETKIGALEEAKEKRLAEEAKKKQASSPQPVNNQRGVAQ